MTSQATSDGQLAITVTFALGTDLDTAQVLVQNRVAVAEARLPEEVRRIGVTVRKSSPDMLMVIHLQLAGRLARPALHLELRDAAGPRRAGAARRRRRRARLRRARLRDAHLARPGEGRLAQSDRRRGRRGAPRAERPGRLRRRRTSRRCPSRAPFSSTSRRSGGSSDPRQFGNIVVKTDDDGRVTRLEDIAPRRARGAGLHRQRLSRRAARPCRSWSSSARARTRSRRRTGCIATMEELSKNFPPGSTTTSSTTRPSSSPNPWTR